MSRRQMRSIPNSSLSILLLLSLAIVSGEDNGRRILHQPLFPFMASDPPPPPPPVLDLPQQDQPFFHELPFGPSVDQTQQMTPPPPFVGAVESPVAPPSSSSIKKVAVAAALTVVTLALVLALAFYLCKRRGEQQDESRKLVGGNSMAMNVESRMPPPAASFLYIGTVEPSAGSLIDEATVANGSPYRKLNSEKILFDRYRPSPELQPLPPLPKPPRPPPPSQRQNSPPPMSSSDDDTNFYTPQGSSFSNGSPVSRQNRIHQSKRTSPKSRLSLSSPDTKPVIIPSIKQSQPPSPPPPPVPAIASSLGPPLPSKTLPYTPKRVGPKFPPPPPPPDILRLRSITASDRDKPSIPIPPPPPPNLENGGSVESTAKSPFPDTVTRSELKDNIPKETVTSTSNLDEEFKEDRDGSKPRLKPLHWDKVRATSERATVWDQMKSSSFQLNEDAIESLFGCSSSGKDTGRKPVMPISQQGNRVLDPKKSQNIAILLRALNVTVEEVAEALLDGNLEGLGLELLETLVKMAPTKEEEIKLKSYNGEISKLGSAERFLKEILDIPFAFKRVEAMLYRANFDNEIIYLSKSFQTLEEASEELRNSPLFLKLLEAVLRTGNRMNDGTNRGHARAFKLDTLLKLVDIKGTDGKTTLLHFVVQEVIRSEGAESEASNETQQQDFRMKEDEFRKKGLHIVSGLSKELGNVKKAAGMDSDVLNSYLSKLEMGLEKVKSVIQYEKPSLPGDGFFDSMKVFVKGAVEEISRIKSQEKEALSMVKEVTEYFHGDAAKEEAHPFRIFMIVRDFLSVLDNVCKEIGKQKLEKASFGAGRSFRMAPIAATQYIS